MKEKLLHYCPRCGTKAILCALACDHLVCQNCLTMFEQETNLCTDCYAGECTLPEEG